MKELYLCLFLVYTLKFVQPTSPKLCLELSYRFIFWIYIIKFVRKNDFKILFWFIAKGY